MTRTIDDIRLFKAGLERQLAEITETPARFEAIEAEEKWHGNCHPTTDFGEGRVELN